MEAGPGAAVVQMESDVPAAARDALGDTGLPVQILAARDDGVGHAQVVRAAGRLRAASDPRADGAALTAQS